MIFNALVKDVNWQKQRKCVRLFLELNEGYGDLLPQVVKWCEGESWVKTRMLCEASKTDLSFVSLFWKFKTELDHGMIFVIDILGGENVIESLLASHDRGDYFTITLEDASEVVYGTRQLGSLSSRNKRKSFRTAC